MKAQQGEDKNYTFHHMIWFLAASLSVAHIYFLAEPISLLYSIIVSVFILLLSLFISIITSEKYYQIINENIILTILVIYVLFLTWLGLNKTIPEYKEIVAFQNSRSEIVYRLALKERGALYKMAHLYLHAPVSIGRIEANVNHKGALIMSQFLEEKIKAGDGAKYLNDMYDLAEISFKTTGHEFAKTWYLKALNYGKEGAMERYEERIKTITSQ